MQNTMHPSVIAMRLLAAVIALSASAAMAQGSQLQVMRSMVGGCLEAFPALRPTYEAKLALLAERNRDIWPDKWSFATAPQAPFTSAMLKQEGGQLCTGAIDRLDQMSLRHIVGMPEKAEATSREEELTRRLLSDDGSRVGIGIRFGMDAPARVQAVFPSSPAQVAGIQSDDEIVSVAGKPTPSGTDVMLEILAAAPDLPLAIELRRGEQRMLVSVIPARLRR